MLDYRIATVCEYRHAYRALLPLEGEGEDEGRSKATNAADSHKPLTSVLSPSRQGEADLPTLKNEKALEN